MEPPVRVRIQDAYERIKADIPVGVNPVVKVPLSIWTHNTKLHINEIEPMDTGGGGGTAGGTTTGGTTGTTGQASTRQVANQSRQVTLCKRNSRYERTRRSDKDYCAAQPAPAAHCAGSRTRDSSAAALRGWLETWLGAELTKLNGNICRIAVQPPRMATPDQVDEWMHGIGGNKPAKNFTADDIRACKSTYSRRKPLWTLMATLVNSGKAPAWVITKIEHHYKGSVLNITAAIKQDTIMGSLHEDLCIVRAQ
ncbi:hypothetical protein SEMRO_149_G068560.1 [Seminavis robusta]|uniref:Uncharacterized protein n=1 Tax=Seminavis robusta TaxID=568900 RepID=A0A9N8H7T1_9STRA|nr:hypothetical protein SEMRO_149_G068560.1 [Seminavis robusta]|eukprot:Sro149_g068560.1 n/a (253) ;mRNA; f:69898-70884